MDPMSVLEMSLPEWNEMCVITLGLVAVFMIGLIICDGIGHLWMMISHCGKKQLK